MTLPRCAQRVCLRTLRADDLARFQACRADPEVGRWQGWTPMSDAEAVVFLLAQTGVTEPLAGGWVQLAIAQRHGDTLIGDIGLRLDGDGSGAEIGFTLAREAQGHGLAAEAVGLALAFVFDTTAAARVQAITDTRNLASVRLLQRLGFRLEATLDAEFRGEPCREHHFVIDR